MTSKNQAVDALIAQLDNGDEVDRCYAARALGQLQDPRALEVLYRHLQDEDLDVCIDAATALGCFGSDDAVQGLLDALHYHADTDVKQAAVEGLAKCGGTLATDTLQQLLQRPDDIQWSETEAWDDWWDLQLQAVKALGNHGVVSAAPALAAMLDSDDGQDIESEVLKALVQIGPAGIDQLVLRLEDADSRRLRRVAKALSHSTTTEANELLQRLLNLADTDVRVAAIETLACTASSANLSALIARLDDPAAPVQASAIKGLQKLNLQGSDGLSSSQLQALLDNSDGRVRCAVLTMLSQQLKPGQSLPLELLEPLQRGLGSPHEEEQRLCCELIASAEQSEASEQLLALIDNLEAPLQVRRQAVQAIAQQGVVSEAVLQALWRCSQDSNEALRHVALQGLLALNAAPLSDDEPKSPIPSALELLLNTLTGTPMVWPSDGVDSEDEEVEEIEAQRIPLVEVDDQGAIEVVTAPVSPPTMESILASVSDAYPAPVLVADGEQASAEIGSTLDSITRSNIEATVGVDQQLSSDSERILGLVDALPEEYADFADVVHTNARSGERMILEKGRKPEQIEAERRILAARVLGDCAQVEVVQPLLACLMDEDATLRREAAESLGRLVAKDPKLPGLGNLLGPLATQLRAGNEEIRLACARTLGVMKHRAAVPVLLAALDDPDTLVRIQAIRSLTAIAHSKSKQLSDDDHVVLSEVTPSRITQAILDCRGDSEIGVRKAVIEALVTLRQLDLELLLSLGLEEGGALTLAAGSAMKALAADAATERLIQALEEISDSTVRRLAIQLLQEIHGVEAA